MEYILSLSALINAAGGFLFFVVGIAILLLARGSRRGVFVGLLSTAFGLTFIVENLLEYALRSTIEAWIVGALMGVTAALAVLAAFELVANAPPRARRVLAGLTFAGIIGSFLAVLSLALHAPLRLFSGVSSGSVGLFVFGTRAALMSGLVLLIFAGAMRFRSLPASANQERRAVAAVAVAFGLFTVFWVCGNVIAPLSLTNPTRILLFSSIFALGIGALTASALFVMGRGHEPALGRRVFLALIVAGFLAVPVVLATGNDFAAASAAFGLYGILRTVGAVFLVRAVLSYDLLGVPLPHIAVRKGAIATGALATLFIVAQVAQNFLSSAYGLVTGGIVAGAFLFAAQPLQRAMENLMAPRNPKPSAAVPRGRTEENEGVYRLALKKFQADGRITPEEELALAHLADALGLTTRRATEIRLELKSKRGR